MHDSNGKPAAARHAVVVRGGRQLHGTVAIPGTKHGAVLAFAAAVATGAKLSLSQVPAITDRWVLAETVRRLGGTVAESGAIVEVNGAITGREIPCDLARQVHGSLYMLPAVLANQGSVIFHGAGGDSLGRFERGLARPIQHMLDVMAAFGAQWEWQDDNVLRVRASRLSPTRINLLRWSTDQALPEGPHVSGASKTALLMAAAAPGTSVILHPHAREAQHELIGVLRSLGVAIDQRDACWLVTGGTFRSAAQFQLMPCPVEFATWQAIAAVTNSEFTATCGDAYRLIAAVHRELDFLARLGIEPSFGASDVALGPAKGSYPGQQLVAECTGISTDITPLLALVLNGAVGVSTVRDRVWGDRFGYASELNRLGAAMAVRDGSLVITPAPLRPSMRPLEPADTRSVAACVAAALAVPGSTVVRGIEHLDRGYGDFVGRLRSIGADVEVIDQSVDGIPG
jgi:UDP-N-acetylglucosamine 1-carboxyvinyltransferase